LPRRSGTLVRSTAALSAFACDAVCGVTSLTSQLWTNLQQQQGSKRERILSEGCRDARYSLRLVRRAIAGGSCGQMRRATPTITRHRHRDGIERKYRVPLRRNMHALDQPHGLVQREPWPSW
jgi:hypothetical protein